MAFNTGDPIAALPETEVQLQAAAARSRKLLHQRSMVGAVASTIPIPGLDWAVDAALMSKLLPRINEEFGLSPEQLDQLHPAKREQVQNAVSMVGSVVIGKLVTRQMVMRLAKAAGARMASKRVVKFIPLAGQLVAASIGYAALRFLGEQHIRDCIRVVRWVQDLPDHANPNG